MATLVRSWLFIILLFTFCNLQVHGRANPRVMTRLGEIVGRYVHVDDPGRNRSTEVKEFLGIPFAKPPIGNLRFRRPIPIQPWKCTLHCQIMPSACFQSLNGSVPWRLHDPHMSEDCLYLNIWVPRMAKNATKKSVLFFVHGGGYLEGSGSARQRIYEGHIMAGLGDVIVVVPNYRLGTLGFWTNNGTTAPGNAGIWDVIEALRWVNIHISSFGGNRESVTVAGQGAGAVIVSLLGVSRFTRGLFKRQIVQSGSAVLTFFDDPQRLLYKSQRTAEMVGCASVSDLTINATGTFFRQFDDDRIVEECMIDRSASMLMAERAQENTPFIPRWGDGLFPTNPKEALLEANFTFTELFIGISGHEGNPLLLERNTSRFGRLGEKSPVFNRSSAENFIKDWFNSTTLVDFVNKTYFQEPDNLNDPRIDWRLKVAEAIGDFQVVCPTIFYASLCKKSGVKVYFYNFDYRPSKSVWARWMGQTHFDEVDFIFGGPFKNSEYYREEEMYISRMLLFHWSRFVKTGKPEKDWPLYGDRYETMKYTGARNPEEGVGLQGHRCALWKEHLYPDHTFDVPPDDEDDM